MWRVALLALIGCDGLFGLAPISSVGDAQTDTRADTPIDIPIDVALANHDEDGDGIDDAIDPCPAIRELAPQDGDGDGVGDACDPHPTLPIDRIRYFDSFETFDLTRWSIVSGSWAADGVGGVVEMSGSDNQLALLELNPVIDPTVSVVISTIAGIDAGAYIKTGGTGSLPEGIACYYDYRDSVLVFFENRNVLGSPAGYVGGTVSPFALRLTAQASTGDPATGPPLCTAVSVVSETSATIGNSNVTPAIASGRIGLYTYTATATFTSVTVFDRKPI